MREIEIRRHSCTKKGPSRGRGSHLSSDGVALAREVSLEMGTFDLVLTSEVPRTLETAIAMGFAVDEQQAIPTEIASAAMAEIGHHDRWTWETPWVRFFEMIDTGGPVARLGSWLREMWIAALESVPDDGRVLVVSHGRMIEVGVISCLSDALPADLATWGESLHQCEGVRLSYEKGQFCDPRIFRTRRCASVSQ
jgi:broad specificity phosphatase PhoE